MPRNTSSVSLFNGRDLKGWKPDGGGSKYWKVEDGELIQNADKGDRSRFGWLLTDRDFSNFLLRFDFKLSDGGDSGVALRAMSDEKPGGRPVQLQVQIVDDDNPPLKGDALTGGLFWSMSEINAFEGPDLGREVLSSLVFWVRRRPAVFR